MGKISTKHILYKNVCSSCTTHMYINTMQCAKRYHPWNVSIICLYQYANMFIYQYANHVHPPICQPCSSTDMPTMCIYQYVNHVHLPIWQPCASENMPTMWHITHDMSPLWTKCHNHVSQTNSNCCANQVISSIFHTWVYQTCTSPCTNITKWSIHPCMPTPP